MAEEADKMSLEPQKNSAPRFGLAKIFGLAKRFSLQIFLAALVALYFLAAPKTEKAVTSALLNPKYEPDQIELFEPGKGSLVLKKTGAFWFGQMPLDAAGDENTLYFICDNTVVNKLLYNLKSIVNLYEISYTNSAKDNFGLRQDRAFLLKIRQKTQVVSSLKFGSVDSLGRIFLTADKNTKIWSTDSAALAPYLTANAGFWAAPEIFPKDLVGADKKYRHGKLARGADGRPLLAAAFNWSDASVKVYDAGDGNLYRAYFLPRTDGDYWCRLEAVPAAQRPQEEKDAMKKLNAVFVVSAWTYSRALEE